MSDRHLSCYSCERVIYVKKPVDKPKRISVRLDNEASQILEEAKANGYTTSQFVLEKMKNSNIIDLNSLRNIMISINKIQYEIEFEENMEMKSSIREELNNICQSLKSFQSHI